MNNYCLLKDGVYEIIKVSGDTFVVGNEMYNNRMFENLRLGNDVIRSMRKSGKVKIRVKHSDVTILN